GPVAHGDRRRSRGPRRALGAGPSPSAGRTQTVSGPMTPVLRVEGLRKSYGHVRAVDGVDAEIGEGELVSFVGPSGCGKTTLLRMVGGFVRPDDGRVVLDGRDVTRD